MKDRVVKWIKNYLKLSIKDKFKYFLYLILVLFVINITLNLGFFYITKSDDVINITGKERITKSTVEGFESYYVVYTDKGAFKVTDALVILRWNSSDVYGKLKVGSCYSMTSYGLRVPFLSWYKNMYNVNQVDCK